MELWGRFLNLLEFSMISYTKFYINDQTWKKISRHRNPNLLLHKSYTKIESFYSPYTFRSHFWHTNYHIKLENNPRKYPELQNYRAQRESHVEHLQLFLPIWSGRREGQCSGDTGLLLRPLSKDRPLTLIQTNPRLYSEPFDFLMHSLTRVPKRSVSR